MNVVGNVLGPAAGSDPRSAVAIDTYICADGGMGVCIYSFGDDGTAAPSYGTALLHGNFDTVHDAVIWDPDVPDHQIPASLYLAGEARVVAGRQRVAVDRPRPRSHGRDAPGEGALRRHRQPDSSQAVDRRRDARRR